MPLSGYLTTTPSDLLLAPAIVRVSSANLGVTRGAPRFTPGWEVVPLEFEGRHAPIRGLDRKFYGEAEISFTLLDIGNAATGNQIAKLEAGATAASAGTPNVNTITPKDGGALYASGDYLTDVRLIWERSIGSGNVLYFALHFPVALVKSWTLTDTARDVAAVDVVIAARKDMASGDIVDAPYKIEYREALP